MGLIRIYLVRHGDAEPADRGGDAARHLTAEGKARFAALLRSRRPALQLSRILTSPLVRARETASLLAAQTGAPVQEEPRLAAGRSTGPELLALAEQAGPDTALVGHNPEIAEAVVLSSPEPHQVTPGTVAAIDAGPSSYRLAWIQEA